MLDILTRGFTALRNKLYGMEELTEAVVDDVLGDVRRSLLEADVALPVVKKFTAQVKEKALGETVQVRVKFQDKKARVSASDIFLRVCEDELIGLLGPVDTTLKYKSGGPSVVMLVGLQGSGKTTTAGKLASFLEKSGKRPMLAAADIYRPAAVDQLKFIGDRLKIPVYSREGADPVTICREAVAEAARAQRDVVILDTAGRLAIDEPLMRELEEIKRSVRPENILVVCDAMIGQDAVRMSTEFNRRLNVDGFIMTKLDGDTRGGSTLSVKEVTGKPIKFVGMGENLDRLEEFRPEGIASRMLGFGDVVGLARDFEGLLDEKKAEEDAARMLQGGFTLGDFVEQIRTLRKMGPLSEVMEKIPGMAQMMPKGAQFDESAFVPMEAMVDSMTPDERRRPQIINQSRALRIARGSGRKAHEVRNLIAQHSSMKKMMSAIAQPASVLSKIPGLKKIDNFLQMRHLAKELMGDQDLSSMMEGMDTPFKKKFQPEFSSKNMSEDELRKLKNKRKAERKAKKGPRKKK